MSEFSEVGKVLAIHDEQQVTDTFKKRNIWIETDSKYPQILEFQFVQDNCSKLNDFSKGENVRIHFDLRGRGYTNKEGKKMVFNSLQGWRIEKLGAEPKQEAAIPAQPEPQGDDLPF